MKSPAALILYPRYLDPGSLLRCPPEVLVEGLAVARGGRPSAGMLAELARMSAARALYLGRSLKQLAARFSSS